MTRTIKIIPPRVIKKVVIDGKYCGEEKCHNFHYSTIFQTYGACTLSDDNDDYASIDLKFDNKTLRNLRCKLCIKTFGVK
jgi:hypothetical protein